MHNTQYIIHNTQYTIPIHNTEYTVHNTQYGPYINVSPDGNQSRSANLIFNFNFALG